MACTETRFVDEPAGAAGVRRVENSTAAGGGGRAGEGVERGGNAASGGRRVRMGADGPGEHDDLVMAVALACWRAKRKENSFGTRRLV